MSAEEVTSFYGHDHDELDGFLIKFRELKFKDFFAAKPFFKSFKFGLQRHILWEEEILFSIFEAKTGMKDNGPTAVMRREHILIKEALEVLHQKVRQGDPNSDQEEKQLVQILKEHNMKEENILYPALDRLLTQQEHEDLFKRMKDVPEERYAFCGCKDH